jgi:organic hydroperoxide reductase OsmC/OhrA
MVEAATQAHHQAHEWCFIANSVNFPVRVEPAVEVGVSDARAEGPA